MKKINFCLISFLFFVSVSAFGMTTHTMKSGDTLWALATKYYGDGSLYTILSKYNNISNPRTIPNGKVIKIPSRSELDDFKNGKSNNNSQSKPNNIKDNNSSELTEEDLEFEKKLTSNIKANDLQKGNNEDI